MEVRRQEQEVEELRDPCAREPQLARQGGLVGLQGSCRTVVFGELDWSPGVHEQATGRVHRDGQAEPVVAYYLMAESGSDPIVAQVLGIKRQQIEGVRDPDAAIVQTAEAREDATKMLARAALLTIQRDPDRGSLMPVPEPPTEDDR